MGLGACSASTAGGRSNYIFPTTERTLAGGSSPSLFNGRVSLPPAAVLDSRQQSLPTVYVMGTVHHPLASSCSTFIVGNSFHAVWHGKLYFIPPREHWSLIEGIHKPTKAPNQCSLCLFR